jgi:UDP-glucose 4-epimerase
MATRMVGSSAGSVSPTDWRGVTTLVTGGASFIGSHLVDRLVDLGAIVRVVDNLSSGRLQNLQRHLAANRIELIEGSLLNPDVLSQAVARQQFIFHLAADHGGRGYVDLHQAACASNLALDSMLFLAAKRAGAEKVVYASSGCVYPNYKQQDPTESLFLSEEMVGPPFDADNMYGWAKLMGEMTLKAYVSDWGMKAASCRYFTVYGERGKEDHAVIAMIARAFIKQNPFDVWGNGQQVRNWTYVGDIVDGTIKAAENIDDGTAVNLGTMERTRVIDAVCEVLRYTGHHATIRFLPEMPTGPMNRVADNALALERLNWRPTVGFIDGLHRTIDWYFANRKRADVSEGLELALTER